MFLIAAVSPEEGFARPMRVSRSGEFVIGRAAAIVSACIAGVEDRFSVRRVDVRTSAQNTEKAKWLPVPYPFDGGGRNPVLEAMASLRVQGPFGATISGL